MVASLHFYGVLDWSFTCINKDREIPIKMFSSISRKLKKSTRPYLCTICQKSFTRPSSLNTHYFSHSGEQPFMCSYPGCLKTFSVLSNMRRHYKIHEREVLNSSFSSTLSHSNVNKHTFSKKQAFAPRNSLHSRMSSIVDKIRQKKRELQKAEIQQHNLDPLSFAYGYYSASSSQIDLKNPLNLLVEAASIYESLK